jgi:hypothetical protein
VLQAVAAAAPGAGKHNDSGVSWKDVYTILSTAWNGGKGGHLPVGKLITGLLSVWKMKSYAKTAKAAAFWRMLNPAYAQRLLAEAAPTLNNSWIVRTLSGPLARVPGMARSAGWLSDATRATPVFTKIGIAGGVVSVGLDINKLAHDDPGKDPAAFATDLARTGFDVSTTAFLIAPNPITGGAVVVTGLAWAGTEVWQHHAEITHALDNAKDFAVDEVKDVGEGAKHAVSSIGHGAKHAVSGIKHFLGG